MTPPLRQKAARSVVWNSAGQWGFHVINGLSFILLTRLLQPEDFGIWALVNLFHELSLAVVLSGFTVALIQKKELSSTDINSAFWGQIVLATLFILVAQLIAAPLALFFQIPEMELIWRVVSALVILDALNVVPLALIQREFSFHIYAQQKLLAVLMAAITGVYAAFSGYGVWSFVIFHGTMAIVRLGMMWICCGWKPKIEFSLTHFKQLFGFSYRITASQLLTLSRKRIGDLLIGYVFGPAVLGLYNIAYRVVFLVMDAITTPLNLINLSLTSRLQDQPEKAQVAYTKLFRLKSILVLPTFCGICLLAPSIIPQLFGEQWTAATLFLQILSLSGIGLSLYELNTSTLAALGKASVVLRLSLLFTLASCLAYAIAIFAGVEYVAMTCLVLSLASWPVSFRCLKQHLKGSAEADSPSVRLIKTCFACFIMCLAVYTYAHHIHTAVSWSQLITSITLGALSFGGTLLIIDRAFIDDIGEFASYFKSGRQGT